MVVVEIYRPKYIIAFFKILDADVAFLLLAQRQVGRAASVSSKIAIAVENAGEVTVWSLEKPCLLLARSGKQQTANDECP